MPQLAKNVTKSNNFHDFVTNLANFGRSIEIFVQIKLATEMYYCFYIYFCACEISSSNRNNKYNTEMSCSSILP